MDEISKKDRDFAMRAIIDYHKNAKGHSFIEPEYLYHQGLNRDKDAKAIVDVLVAMGLLKYDNSRALSNNAVLLTERGRCYFETEADAVDAQKKQYAHDWRIAVFSALVGALASEPLWRLIHYLVNLLQY